MKRIHTTKGFIALISTIIISFVLTALLFTVSTSSFYARADSQGGEAKRISLGLAESCTNVALLNIARNYNYNSVVQAAGGATTTIGTDAQGFPQVCVIKSVTVISSDTEKKVLDIAVQSEYRDAFSNINTRTTVYDPNVVKIPAAYVTVTAIVGPGGTKQPSDFPLFLDGVSVASGQTVAVTPNNPHSVTTGTIPSGYVTDGVWIGCAGGSITPTPGTSNSCTIYYTVQPTKATLTLIANIPPGDNAALFPMTITKVGVATPMGTVTSGVPTTTPPGSYNLGYSMPSGYTTTGWDCPGPLVLIAGQIQYCTVTFTKPSLSCANTVVMLDRSGSMFDAPIVDERKAANALLDLYGGVTPRPSVSLGRFGDIATGNSAEIMPTAHLTTVYGASGSVASTSMKNPTGGGGPQTWLSSAQGRTSELPTPLYTTSSVNGQEQGYGYYGLSVPSGAIIDGIEVVVNGKATVSTNIGVDLSWDNGVATATISTKIVSLTTTAATTTLGSATDTWRKELTSTPWTANDFSNGNFIVKLKNNAPNGQTVSVDFSAVRVWYHFASSGLYAAIETGLPKYQTNTTNQSSTNLSAAIDAAVVELNSVSDGKQKVLIIISDGLPTLPGNTTNAKNTASSSALVAKNATNNVKIFTIHFGSASGQSFLAGLSSGPSYTYVAPTSGQMPAVFQQVGAAACPAVVAATQSHLNVITTVINNDGGVKQASDFSLTVTGGVPDPVPNTFTGSPAGTSVSVTPGATITVTETGPTGYFSPYYSGCTGIIVAAGETKTCTIVNDDTPAPLPPPDNPPPPQDIDIGSWVETATTTPSTP